jgi:hypothetical protein
VRSLAQIQANYRAELSATSDGLLANWWFDEASGVTSADLLEQHQALLYGGATFSTSVHP